MNTVTLMLKISKKYCNMTCKYCYEVINKDYYNECSSEEVIEYLKKYINYQRVFIIFHGGEPLLVDKEDITQILKFISTEFNNNYDIQFQTNGTLIDDEWIKIFKKYSNHLSISISLDPKGLEDLRICKDFDDYRKIVENNIKKLIQNNIKNIGIVSVAHKLNLEYYEDFILYLIDIGIKNLTINKYRKLGNNFDNKYYIKESEYNEKLKKLIVWYIENRFFEYIKIQPIISLLANTPNKLCIYLPDTNKCSYFKTFYNKNIFKEVCDHISDTYIVSSKKCFSCDIYNWCGGGCQVEEKNDDFCSSRKSLKKFIERIKDGNKKFKY